MYDFIFININENGKITLVEIKKSQGEALMYLYDNFATRMFMSLVFDDVIKKTMSNDPEAPLLEGGLFDKMIMQISQQETKFF